MEGVGLDLVDRGNDLVVVDQVDQSIWMEVGDTDRPDQAFVVDRKSVV